ncbi:unnamed protein product [Moneuplotes crassus]|uniref:Nucleoporin Nup54 alpha-helical domain-containing protein n=1 Tax=Euplotes crassus TaxID=5936 RepID=A0AAD1XF69_EUPCR|nr:unnamed protein product [Moneuplotes crassus]
MSGSPNSNFPPSNLKQTTLTFTNPQTDQPSLFGAPQKQNANPTGLFSSKNTTANNLFGGRGNSTEARSTPFGATTTTSEQSNNLFGSKRTLVGFTLKPSSPFSPQPRPFSTLGESRGIFQNKTTPFSSSFNQQPQLEAGQDEAEIEACLNNYAKYVDPTNPRNVLVGCMYNKFNKNVSGLLKEHLKNITPARDIAQIPENSKLNGESVGFKQVEVLINQKKFTKAKNENPNPDQLYIKQINSFEELYERLYKLKKTTSDITEVMKSMKKKMNLVKNKTSSKAMLKKGINSLKENMKILREKILTVQSKMSLLQESPYLSLEDHEKLQIVFNETTQPSKIPGKIEIVKGKLEELLEARGNHSSNEPQEIFNKISSSEKKRVISILREQTKGIFSLIKETKRNAFKLEAIEFIAQSIKQENRERKINSEKYVD